MNRVSGKVVHRGYVATVLGCYCPRCREGKLFQHPLSFRLKDNMVMHASCPLCGQPTDIEVGFYYGTSYISYLVGIVISAIHFPTWWLIIGFSYSDHRFFYWLLVNSLLLLCLQPWLMRFSRSLWISCFVPYNPLWAEHKPAPLERTNEEQMNNW